MARSGPLLAQPAATGTTISLSPAANGVRLWVHSAVDPSLLRLSGRQPQFTATLPRLLPSGSTLVLDTARLDRAAPHLLAALGALGIGGGVQPLLHRLGKALVAQGVNVQNVLRCSTARRQSGSSRARLASGLRR